MKDVASIGDDSKLIVGDLIVLTGVRVFVWDWTGVWRGLFLGESRGGFLGDFTGVFPLDRSGLFLRESRGGFLGDFAEVFCWTAVDFF